MLRDLLSRLRRTPAPTRPVARHPQPALWGAASGRVDVSYEPRADGRADPGEVVWPWVAYEDDPNQGKDRPVLIIGRRGAWLAGLMLTSKDHGSGAPSRAGRHFLDIGTGPWDSRRWPSEVRLDRLIDVDPARVRREGSRFDRYLFDRVVAAARQHLPELR